jgi:hypothetical protein
LIDPAAAWVVLSETVLSYLMITIFHVINSHNDEEEYLASNSQTEKRYIGADGQFNSIEWETVILCPVMIKPPSPKLHTL